MHPDGSDSCLTVAEELTWAPVAVIASEQDFSDVIGALQVPVVRIVDDLTRVFVMRSEQGHSTRGLRPLLRLVMLLRTLSGRNVGL